MNQLTKQPTFGPLQVTRNIHDAVEVAGLDVEHDEPFTVGHGEKGRVGVDANTFVPGHT